MAVTAPPVTEVWEALCAVPRLDTHDVNVLWLVAEFAAPLFRRMSDNEFYRYTHQCSTHEFQFNIDRPFCYGYLRKLSSTDRIPLFRCTTWGFYGLTDLYAVWQNDDLTCSVYTLATGITFNCVVRDLGKGHHSVAGGWKDVILVHSATEMIAYRLPAFQLLWRQRLRGRFPHAEVWTCKGLVGQSTNMISSSSTQRVLYTWEILDLETGRRLHEADVPAMLTEKPSAVVVNNDKLRIRHDIRHDELGDDKWVKFK